MSKVWQKRLARLAPGMLAFCLSAPLFAANEAASPPCSAVNARPAHGAADPLRPLNLCVPAMAPDEKSLVLVWNKPDDYRRVVDFRVYMDGKPLGLASENNTRHSPAKPYIDHFYAQDKTNFHVRVLMHNFTVTGLAPDTAYRFTVRSVFSDGTESADSAPVVARTTPVPVVLDVTAAKYGAVGDGKTLVTTAIQSAIDDCPVGCKVLLPAGVYRSGALFLKSNMTFELAEGAILLGSERAADYPMEKGYVLYEYMDPKSNARPPSLLNVLAAGKHRAGSFENIRIVGKGTIDGNGWLRAAPAEIRDELGRSLPQYRAGNRNRVGMDGLLARHQVDAAVAEGMGIANAYNNRRSSLVTVRGVRNLYYADFTALNPAFHGIMNLESENVTVNGVIHKTYDVNNGDGIEFGNSRNAMVFNNFIDTGDDCINFAAGQGSAAAGMPVQQHAWIFNNYFREGHGAVVAGSHTGAWVEHVLAEDNVLFRTDVALRLKSTPPTGGGARHFTFRDNAARDISRQGFIFTLAYSAGVNTFAKAGQSARFHDFNIRNVSLEGGGAPFLLVDGVAEGNGDGYPETWHENLLFENVRVRGMRPASIRHLRNSVFRDVEFSNVTGGDSPWGIANAPGLRFEGRTPPP